MSLFSVEQFFCNFNKVIRNNLEFLNIIEQDTELYEFTKYNLEKYVDQYRSFLFLNDIPMDMVPDDIKELVFSNIKKKKY